MFFKWRFFQGIRVWLMPLWQPIWSAGIALSPKAPHARQKHTQDNAPHSPAPLAHHFSDFQPLCRILYTSQRLLKFPASVSVHHLTYNWDEWPSRARLHEMFLICCKVVHYPASQPNINIGCWSGYLNNINLFRVWNLYCCFKIEIRISSHIIGK